jgi:UDP-N-acetylmuramyl pentapeptide phosphotransferase/UDP-N-acetylglucosamine-1-phosphate transferase|tara:strand:+ start:410 stop:1438 length:1029 start_codon:yes stop_codon:yes gene_type:complete
MNIVGIVIAALFIITISNFVFKKFNILIDRTNISNHKSFINGHKTTPLLGGVVFFLILVFFLPKNYQYFTILIFFIFLTGLLSDLDILHSPLLRVIFQTIVIVVYLFLFDNFIPSTRVDFFDNLLNIFFIKLFFTSFCILVLINGTNFIDGVNTLVVGYFILVASNILYLTEVIGLDLDILLVSTCLTCLVVIYIFNFFGKTYLGDGGAYLISFVIGVTLIKFSNDNYLVSPYYIVALLWYPAYENLFSIIRKKILKKSPSTPDNEHLHQLIYLYLDKSFNINKNSSNTLSGILICLYNLFYFLFILDEYHQTETLVYSVIFNVLIYSLLYFLLKKKLYKNK